MNERAEAPYEIALIDADRCAGDVLMLRFERPEGYTFTAGQFFEVGLETDEGFSRHIFSHAAAPSDSWLEVGTRLTGSAYKRALEALRPGDTVTASAPRGRLTVPADAAGLVFLVGGIGVTPARSILRELEHAASQLPVVMLYGNRDETCVPYLDELRALAARRPNVHMELVLSEPAAGWTGAKGYINAERVRYHADPGQGWYYIVAGPPAMIGPMRAVLDELGVERERQGIESFAGYGRAD